MPLSGDCIFSYMVDMVCDMKVNCLDMTELIMASPRFATIAIFAKIVKVVKLSAKFCYFANFAIVCISGHKWNSLVERKWLHCCHADCLPCQCLLYYRVCTHSLARFPVAAALQRLLRWSNLVAQQTFWLCPGNPLHFWSSSEHLVNLTDRI